MGRRDEAEETLEEALEAARQIAVEADRAPVLAEAASLLRCEGGGEFAVRYEAAIQRSPDVAVAGARARKAVSGKR